MRRISGLEPQREAKHLSRRRSRFCLEHAVLREVLCRVQAAKSWRLLG